MQSATLLSRSRHDVLTVVQLDHDFAPQLGIDLLGCDQRFLQFLYRGHIHIHTLAYRQFIAVARNHGAIGGAKLHYVGALRQALLRQ